MSAGSLAPMGQTRRGAASRQLPQAGDLAGLDTVRHGDPGRWVEHPGRRGSRRQRRQ